MRFQWAGGADAEGTAYADSLSFVPGALRGTLKDNRGAWGEQKIVDFSVSPPKVVGTYQSPTSKVWPPPSNGVFMPREARMLDNDLAFTSWMTDGLRVLDVSTPSAPKEVAALVPPGAADPSPLAGAGPNNAAGGGSLQRGFSWPTQTLVTGVDVRKLSADRARIVLSDINGGLSVVDAAIRRSAQPSSPQPPSSPPGLPPVKPGPKGEPPLLSAFSIRPSSFKALAKGASIAKSGGAKVRYRLSENATTTFTVERIETGRKKAKSCQRPSKANRKGKACTRLVKRSGSFGHKGVAAHVNSFRFSGRLSNRRLAPGRYRLKAVTRNAAGNVGAARTASFRIIR